MHFKRVFVVASRAVHTLFGHERSQQNLVRLELDLCIGCRGRLDFAHGSARLILFRRGLGEGPILNLVQGRLGDEHPLRLEH